MQNSHSKNKMYNKFLLISTIIFITFKPNSYKITLFWGRNFSNNKIFYFLFIQSNKFKKLKTFSNQLVN